MLTITTTFSSASPVEKIVSPSDCYLHDAVRMLQHIQSTVETLNKRDSNRRRFDQVVTDFAAFLYTFCEDKYADLAGRHLSYALTQLWIQYRERIIRLLVELDGVAKRQVRAGIFQRRLGSSSKVSADVARISKLLGDLSMSSMASLSTLVMKAHMSGCVDAF